MPPDPSRSTLRRWRALPPPLPINDPPPPGSTLGTGLSCLYTLIKYNSTVLPMNVLRCIISLC